MLFRQELNFINCDCGKNNTFRLYVSTDLHIVASKWMLRLCWWCWQSVRRAVWRARMTLTVSACVRSANNATLWVTTFSRANVSSHPSLIRSLCFKQNSNIANIMCITGVHICFKFISWPCRMIDKTVPKFLYSLCLKSGKTKSHFRPHSSRLLHSRGLLVHSFIHPLVLFSCRTTAKYTTMNNTWRSRTSWPLIILV